MFQPLVERLYTEHPQINGVVLAIEAPDQDISWAGAIGVADKTGRALSPNQPALIASMTKTYVATAILRLIEQKQLKLYQPIAGLCMHTTQQMLVEGGYDPHAITVAHLLSHTSGIFDYVSSPNFQARTRSDPQHRWTRQEQLKVAMEDGKPQAKPGEGFYYTDGNYLLLTEIIETLVGEPFPKAIRALLRYDELDLKHTWWHLLENPPAGEPKRVQQFATELKVNSYDLHGSIDAYGGGGIIATCSDVARFTRLLFEGRVFDDAETLQLIHTEVPTKDSVPSGYTIGLMKTEVAGFETWGHGGFWGTTMRYVPELNLSLAVFLGQRDEWERYNDLIGAVIRQLKS